jgi:uncharacterized protein
MKIIWDEPKRLANLLKHGFDFQDIHEFDWASAVVQQGKPNQAGNARLKAIGLFRDGKAIVIFASYGREAISIVSFRPANKKERKTFDEQTQN